jgi:hypothetical protein
MDSTPDKASPVVPRSLGHDTSAEGAPAPRRRGGRARPLSQPPPASASIIGDDEEDFQQSSVKVLGIENNGIV